MSDAVQKTKDQLANLQYLLRRQQDHNEGYEQLNDILDKVFIDLAEAIDGLDYAGRLSDHAIQVGQPG